MESGLRHGPFNSLQNATQKLFLHVTQSCSKLFPETLSKLFKAVTFKRMAEGGPPSGGIMLNADAAQIKRLLECPVCYDVILPPINLCHSGHAVCNPCKENLEERKCPICRSYFTNIRDHFAELLLENCLIACKFQEYGCGQELPGMALVDHHRVCGFRPITCHSCGEQVEYQQFLEHLSVKHKFDPHFGHNCSGVFDLHGNLGLERHGRTFYWEPIWLKCFDANFFCCVQCCNGSWWIWVGAYADHEDCEKFACTISVTNRGTRTEIKYVGVVHPMRTNPAQIFANGKCLIFPKVQLKSLRDRDGLNVSVNIRPGGIEEEDTYEELPDEELSNLSGIRGIVDDDYGNLRRLSLVSHVDSRHRMRIRGLMMEEEEF